MKASTAVLALVSLAAMVSAVRGAVLTAACPYSALTTTLNFTAVAPACCTYAACWP